MGVTDPIKRPNVPMEQSVAAESFSAKGKKIGEGKAKERLNVGNKDDKRMAIAAKESLPQREGLRASFQKTARNIRYVHYTTEGGSVDLNISSLAKRLHLTQKEIRSAAKKEQLHALIDASIKSNLIEALDQYHVVFENRSLLSKEGLSTSTLMKAIKEGLKLSLLGPIDPLAWELPGSTKSYGFSIGRHHFSLELNPTHPQELKITSYGKKLGAGAFGEVRSTFQIKQPQVRTAVKRNEDGSLYEAKILSTFRQDTDQIKFHRDENGKAIGIVDAVAVYIIDKHTKNPIARELHMNQYDGSLRLAFHPASNAGKMEIAKQLFMGAANLEKAGIAHFDIKPANILVRLDKGKWKAAISDFGSSKVKEDDREVTAFTHLYVPSALVNKADYASGVKRDKFALGKTLFELFTRGEQEDPFDYISTNPTFNSRVERRVATILDLYSVHPEMIKLITSMLDINNNSTFETLLERFNRAFPDVDLSST